MWPLYFLAPALAVLLVRYEPAAWCTAQMKERPILFSGLMVRAILEDRKTQTRRVIKPVQPRDDGRWPAGRDPVPDCPYGQPGGHLWVREAFCTCYDGQEAYEVIYAADNKRRGFSTASAATDDQLDWLERSMTTHGERGRPAIHMPRWTCRLLLEITGVRVERLQSISEADAEAEGVDRIKAKTPLHRDAYRYLWDDINGPGAWERNPWVWVIEFKRSAPQSRKEKK